MGQTVIEKILAAHSQSQVLKPGDIVDVSIDTRAARDFGGANVVKHLRDHQLNVADPGKTCFTFDCNPTGSDQKYAANQHYCRLYAREKGIRVYDIESGIGTHLMIDKGMVGPGSTAVSTDSHANILGAVGAFGQGMGDMDIAVTWNKGKVWFKVPPSVKIHISGKPAPGISAKEIALNLLHLFGANDLLGYSVELTGPLVEQLSLDARITIASMATELGAIILFISPSEEVVRYCSKQSGKTWELVKADPDAKYAQEYRLEAENFRLLVSKPGKPDNTEEIAEVKKRKIDSGFIGSCTNGRMEDMRAAASVLKGRKIAPGIILKIVPSTAMIYEQCLHEGIIEIFHSSGALVSNPGCAGCAAGQVGQNGPGEVTISTGNRNFPGKQGKGEVYLSSPAIVAASCIAGYITTPDDIPEQPALFGSPQAGQERMPEMATVKEKLHRPEVVEGKIWFIPMDDIDTDMIFHNRYLTITDQKEMGQYTFDNLKGFERFASMAKPGDIVVTGKNFGAGSSRQQAVDCFVSLGIQCIIAESYGAIYERNAINAGFPIVTCPNIRSLTPETGQHFRVNFLTGDIENLELKIKVQGERFSAVQVEIYQEGGIF